MTPGLTSVRPDRPVYRLGRFPDPWAWPDWAYAAPGGTFGNCWDDPLASYRVLYACSQRVGAFVETLARFRPDLAVVAELAEIDSSEDAPPIGVVPRRWLATRSCGEAVVSGRFADVGQASSLATLRTALASRAIHHGLVEIDGAAIRLSAPRAFTQEVSRFVYEWKDANGPFGGLRYLSRLGDTFVNWALFEPSSPSESPFESVTAQPIASDDVDFSQALRLLGLKLALP